MAMMMDSNVLLRHANLIIAVEAEAPPEIQEIQKKIATVETNKISVIFNIEGDYSIKNNNSHEATILIKEFQTKLEYYTIPN